MLFSLAACTQTQSMTPDQPSTVGGHRIDYAGRGGPEAATSVVRVGCAKGSGTGFVHKSGVVITAAHLARDCGDSFVVVTAGRESVSAKTLKRDDLLDLAILSTEKPLHNVRSLLLSTNTTFPIGSRVSTWGYPTGYISPMPLLSFGYLAGVDQVNSPPQWIVNGAFNLGNSGGPVISIEDGSVIGVVSSKLAPFPPGLEASLKALSRNRDNLKYKRQRSDGTSEELSEGQVVAEVLDYLRKQIQLVVGYAVSVKELRKFLEDNGIEP